jgi:hypothetical protein
MANTFDSRVRVMTETLPPERSLEVEALIRNVRASMERAINLGKNISPEVMANHCPTWTMQAGLPICQRQTSNSKLKSAVRSRYS